MGERIGYVRVSTEHQNTARQDTLMDEMNVGKVFREKVSGKDTKRPQLQAMLEYIRQGDTVVVESYSRLARSTQDLFNLVAQIENKGANFVSVKENIDTSTPQGRLMMTVFAGLSQFERECMLERQREGIEEAKKAHKYKGRKPIAIDAGAFEKQYQAWKGEQITARAAMKALGLSSSTFYRRVRELESK